MKELDIKQVEPDDILITDIKQNYDFPSGGLIEFKAKIKGNINLNNKDLKELLFIRLFENPNLNLKNQKQFLKDLNIKTVIFNDDVTVVILEDGKKGIVYKDKNDTFDPIIAFTLAYMYALSDNKKEYKKLVIKLYDNSIKNKAKKERIKREKKVKHEYDKKINVIREEYKPKSIIKKAIEGFKAFEVGLNREK